MKFLYSWICDHLEGAADADSMAERLTLAGLNVEVREKHGTADEIWDVDVTTNRPDAMNHRGLAREAAAAGCGTLKAVATGVVESATAVGTLAALAVEDGTGCPRYCARVVTGVKVGPSPAWLAARLEACGIRPINGVVDATNYVLLDLGQPLHAFDLATLSGRRIVVRRARQAETMATLDGVERTFTPEDVLICDGARAVAVAGVMGGAATEISPRTTEVLLESAYFAPVAVRRTARRLGLSTEASHRFERGADRAMARTAVDAVAALIVRVAGGEIAAGVLDSAPALPAPRTVTFSLERLDAFAGCPLPADRVLAILAALELAPCRYADQVTCTVPSHRVDIELAEDLYEEVLRHFGYDNVPSALPAAASQPGQRLGSWPLTERARNALTAAGLAEAVTYSFAAPEMEAATAVTPLSARGDAVPVTNPISSRLAVMRRSLLAGLVEAAAGNLRRGAGTVAIGEVGRAFFATGGQPREEERLAIVLAGVGGSWDAPRPLDFLDLKGLVEVVLDGLGIGGASWRPAATPLLAAGEGAEIVAGDTVIGVAGRLADAGAALADAGAALWVAELDLAAAAAPGVPVFQALPRFPAVPSDLTIRHKLALPYAELIAAIRRDGPAWIESIAPIARYRGEGVAADEVKTTVRITYRHADRSLTQDEVNAAHFTLMDALARDLGVSFT
jgi:phenylalanyl-tRNA synthetase beta chain